MLYPNVINYYKNNLNSNDGAKNEICEIIEKKIAEIEKKKTLEIILSYKTHDCAIFKTTEICEIKNIDMARIEKIQIKWIEGYLDKNDFSIKKYYNKIMSNKRRLIIKNSEIMGLFVKALECLHEKPLKEIVFALLSQNVYKKPEFYKISNIYLKSLKETIEKELKFNKIIDNEITIYSYGEKKDMYININKVMDDEVTMYKIISYIENYHNIDELEINLILTFKKLNESLIIKDKEDFKNLSLKLKNIIWKKEFKKIEIRRKPKAVNIE